MPPIEDVQRGLAASLRMMAGRADALRQHDLSIDGFWNSFFAIVVALPPLTVGWVANADVTAADPDSFASRLAAVIKLALVDVTVWILPLVVFMLIATRAGLRSRVVPYVVATNWGGAVFAWIMLPPSLIWMVTGQVGDLVAILSLFLFGLSLVLSWRLTNAALQKGPAVATGVFVGLLSLSFVVLFLLQGVFGLSGAG